MENVYLHWAFTIFGFVFPLIRCCILLPLINPGRVVRENPAKPLFGLGTMITCLLFVWVIYLSYAVPLAFVCCNILPYLTIYRSGVIHEDCIVPAICYLAPYRERNAILGHYVLFRSLFALAAMAPIFTLDGSFMRLFCGVAAPVLTVILYCYRLIIIRLVIKTKNVRFIPFSLCLLMFFSSSYWLVFCLLERDPIAAITNGFAFFLGAWQLILFAKYHIKVQRAI